MARRYYGEIVSRREYMCRLGPAIELGVVVADNGGIKVFENAAWSLRRFEVGDEVTWLSSFWRYFWDSRGTHNLEKMSEFWEQGS